MEARGELEASLQELLGIGVAPQPGACIIHCARIARRIHVVCQHSPRFGRIGLASAGGLERDDGLAEPAGLAQGNSQLQKDGPRVWQLPRQRPEYRERRLCMPAKARGLAQEKSCLRMPGMDGENLPGLVDALVARAQRRRAKFAMPRVERCRTLRQVVAASRPRTARASGVFGRRAMRRTFDVPHPDALGGPGMRQGRRSPGHCWIVSGQST